jgi:putative ABC transport system permease protein
LPASLSSPGRLVVRCGVLFVSLRDLEWRRRRFLIGVGATGLVFALAVLLTGISQSFINEVARTTKAFEADQWIVSEKALGPFTATTMLPAQLVDEVRKDPGVSGASPVLITRFPVQGNILRDSGVIGVEPHGLGVPKVVDGRTIERSGEALADRSMKRGVGKTFSIGGVQFRIVGRTKGVSYFAGQPTVFLTLGDAQKLTVAGQPLASAIVVHGHVTRSVPGTHALSNSDVIKDLKRPLKAASGTIDFLRVLLWIVAAGIIGSILYVQAIERTRDFAVFKATGVGGRALAVGLGFQAIVLAILAAIVAVGLSFLLAPLMPMPVETPASGFVLLLVVSVVIGVLASLFGLRRALSVDPALAFGGA